MDEWVSRLRRAIGHDLLMLNSAAVWIEDTSGHVLLQKRSATQSIWGFPGGIMNLGESAEETAIRETREETGLDVRITCLIGIYSKYIRTLENGDQCQTVSFFFKAEVQSGAPVIDRQETFELRYFAPDAAPPLYCQQHQDMLADAINGSGVYFR